MSGFCVSAAGSPDIVSRGAVITAHCRSRLCTGLYGAYTRPLRGGLTGFDNKQLCNLEFCHDLPCLCTWAIRSAASSSSSLTS